MISYKIVLNNKALTAPVYENVPLNQLMKMKPTILLFRKKIIPTTVELVEVFGNTIYEAISRKEDLVWVMSRFQSVKISKDQKVAGWTGFHQQVSSPEHKGEVFKLFTCRVLENHQQRFLPCKRYYNKLRRRQNLLV